MAPLTCRRISPAETEIKSSGWGGRRPGAGRKPAAPVAPLPDRPSWCVYATWPQAELSAASELTRQGYETYTPMVAIRRRDPVLASRWHEVRVPLLPGYGFIRMAQAEARQPVLTTRGVRELLRRPDGRLSCVPDGEIETLRAKDEERLRLPKECRPVLRAGTPVTIADGPFAGFPGAVAECDGAKTLVRVQMFGRSTPVWLDRVAVVES